MSMAERGIYISLLSYCWLQETIPNDPKLAARLCGISARQMSSAWPNVASRFQIDAEDCKRLRHKRLDTERDRQTQWKEKSRQAGVSGANKRWGNNQPYSQPYRVGQGLVLPNDSPREKTDDDDSTTIGFAVPISSSHSSSSSAAANGNGHGIQDRLVTIGKWLEQYVNEFGVNWGPPDTAICGRIEKALNGAPLEDFESLLQKIYQRGQKPSKSYAWFVTLTADEFGGYRAS